MTPPRPIPSCIGSRIRLIFGADGSEWLLLLNHDDGNQTWQSLIHSDEGIPEELLQRLRGFDSGDTCVQDVDFNREGSWFLHVAKETMASNVDEHSGELNNPQVRFGTDVFGDETHLLLKGDNYVASDNLPPPLREHLDRFYADESRHQNLKLNFVRLFDEGDYVISDSHGTDGTVGNSELAEEMKEAEALEDIKEVAVAGDGTWVFTTQRIFVSSPNVDKSLEQHLSTFFQTQRERNDRRAREIVDCHRRMDRKKRKRNDRTYNREMKPPRAVERKATGKRKRSEHDLPASIPERERQEMIQESLSDAPSSSFKVSRAIM